MFKYLQILFLICFYFISNAQPLHPKEIINYTSIPKEIKFKGEIQRAFNWKDSTGEHFILYCETKPYKTNPAIKDSISGYANNLPIYNSQYAEMNQDLYIYYYTKQQEQVKLRWLIRDKIDGCEFDIVLKFEEAALSVTDLNHNNIPEIWVIYKLACTSDVSPLPMKLIMYEGKDKYAIRGETRDNLNNPSAKKDSPKTIDDKFKKADKRILNFALELWKKNNHM